MNEETKRRVFDEYINFKGGDFDALRRLANIFQNVDREIYYRIYGEIRNLAHYFDWLEKIVRDAQWDEDTERAALSEVEKFRTSLDTDALCRLQDMFPEDDDPRSPYFGIDAAIENADDAVTSVRLIADETLGERLFLQLCEETAGTVEIHTNIGDFEIPALVYSIFFESGHFETWNRIGFFPSAESARKEANGPRKPDHFDYTLKNAVNITVLLEQFDVREHLGEVEALDLSRHAGTDDVLGAIFTELKQQSFGDWNGFPGEWMEIFPGCDRQLFWGSSEIEDPDGTDIFFVVDDTPRKLVAVYGSLNEAEQEATRRAETSRRSDSEGFSVRSAKLSDMDGYVLKQIALDFIYSSREKIRLCDFEKTRLYKDSDVFRSKHILTRSFEK